jgi:uncharacterized protein (DUF1499 family)
MVLAWLAFFDALIAIVLAAAGIIGAHFGVIAPFLGFRIFVLGFFLAVLGVIIGLIAIIVTSVSRKRRTARGRAIVAAILSLIVVLPVARIMAVTHQDPRINDITTDMTNPPEFVHAQELTDNRGRDMKYDKTKNAALQVAGYADLAPLKMQIKPDDAFKKAEIIAGEIQGWRITYTDPKTRTIEGVAISGLFRFRDDFVIQIRPGDSPDTSVVDMRSKSRVGLGDFGANYHRIKSFLAILAAPLRTMPPADTLTK